ncbi:MAG: DNA-directed RNA polymerase subunit beta [Akkermansiaceae bacterium]|nr:DNA-directed RNA polymerase subunit beta [Akkermansiaceae bacterium]
MSKERISFGKISEVIQPPNLIEIQTKSYEEFLQRFTEPGKRLKVGLQSVLSEHFPIESYDGQIRLEFVSYEIAPPKTTDFAAIRAGETYSSALYIRFRLKCGDYSADENVYMGEVPMITDRGTFVINGAERVIVAQLHRSPGICYERTRHANGKDLYSFRIIPDRGSWLEVQFDTNDLMYVFLDRRRRRRKFLATTFLRYLGYETDRAIVEQFYTIQNLRLTDVSGEELEYLIPFEDIKHEEQGSDRPAVVIAKAYESLSLATVRKMIDLGIDQIEVIDQREDEILVKTLKKDLTHDREGALREIFSRFRGAERNTSVQQAAAALDRLFKEEKRYDLTRVGRYKLNQKLGLDVPEDVRLIQPIDFLTALKYLLRLKHGEGSVDDIDHLGNRRVRAVGELIANQCRVGFARTERLVKERMTLCDTSHNDLTPSKLINPKALSAVIRDFFGRSQLSQFMDQINPLAELTHKRRLSALGPGGLNRDRAGFEVRDVHPSHYGRICPIETPEGPNIGLINSLCTYARIDEYGFIETPFRKVKTIEKKNKKGEVIETEVIVTNEVEYLSADKEEYHLIAQANNPIDNDNGQGHFTNNRVTAREHGEFIEVDPRRVEYMDVSPKQIISIAAGLIPFLEHDDANRALMGANMQRQGVPLMVNQAPLVGTGIEAKCARDSGAVVVAQAPGIVASATAEYIVTTPDGELPVSPQRWLSDPESVKTNPEKGVYVYQLRKFMRSNASTCINQHPIVGRGAEVKAGDVLADGPCTDGGELALGRNVLVAYMSWYGYNFEDAIIISERLVQEDAYTSIHIEEFEEKARDTKLGPEEITRDIPNVGDEALKNLGSDGVVRIGAEVKPGDILVGKISPKSETDLAPEERLLRAIFGEKAADVKDTSLRVPPGTTGVVMDVRIVRSNAPGAPEVDTEKESLKQRKKVDEEYTRDKKNLIDLLTSKLSDRLLGEKIPLEVTRVGTGEVIIPANRKITKTLLHKLAEYHDQIEMNESPVRNQIFEIINTYDARFRDLDDERDRKLDQIEAGAEMEPGVVTEVKVYIATKRKLGVGDKMAGRHGNKGVCSRVLPVEDMPYLEDGTPVDIILNPLGVPSRMNVGQVLEAHLGVAAKALGFKVATPVFDGIDEKQIWDYMSQAKQVPGFTWVGDGKDGSVAGKSRLIDGLTGEYFHYPVVVGYTYMLKLNHLVADKVHARAVGTYSLVTQQPLGGKAQHGGQRFGEMEVWAMEGYGAAYTLQELLTVKSDDVQGRTRIYENIVRGDNSLEAGTPESFNVLIKEMQALCLNVQPKEKSDQDVVPQIDDFFQLLSEEDDLEKDVEDYENSIELFGSEYDADPTDIIDDAVDEDESEI